MPPIQSWKDDQMLGAGLDMTMKAHTLTEFTGQAVALYL